MERPVASLALRKQLQSFFFHSLEVIWRGARLECAATQHVSAGLGHRVSRVHDLLFALNRAGTRDDDELVSADFAAIDSDLGAARAELLAYELVRRGNPDSLFHTRHCFDRFEASGNVADSDDADHDAFFSFDRVDLVAKLLNAIANGLYVRAVCMHFHRYDHW